MSSEMHLAGGLTASLALLAVTLLLLYVFFFIFIHGAQNKGTPHDHWIRHVNDCDDITSICWCC